MLHQVACHSHKSENLVHAHWRYHLVDRRTMSLKKAQEPTLGVRQTAKHDAWRWIHWYLQTECDHPNTIETIPIPYPQFQIDEKGVKVKCKVSNAAERSRSRKITDLFWSKAIAISLRTLIKAISVRWSFLYADWYETLRPLASK